MKIFKCKDVCGIEHVINVEFIEMIFKKDGENDEYEVVMPTEYSTWIDTKTYKRLVKVMEEMSEEKQEGTCAHSHHNRTLRRTIRVYDV